MGKRRNSIGGQFAPRLIEMLESPAYRALSLSARRVIDRVEIELAHHGGGDNGKLPVTYDHFHEYGIHRHAIGPAIREAVALGFLEVTQAGRAGNAEHRSPNLFRLTYRPAKDVYGTGNDGCSSEWRKIETLEGAEGLANAARQNISQCRKTPRFDDGNRHRKRKSPVTETITTGLSAETITTSISPEGNGQTERKPVDRAPSKASAGKGACSINAFPRTGAAPSDVTGLLSRLESVVSTGNTIDRPEWEPWLSEIATDNAQPEPNRTRAQRLLCALREAA